MRGLNIQSKRTGGWCEPVRTGGAASFRSRTLEAAVKGSG